MKEAIILAGGFGTRLKHIVSDVPKPMAPIKGEPFLSILFDRLQKYGVERVILSTGYMHEAIESFYGTKYRSLSLLYSQESTPLGTGGAILMALNQAQTDDILVLNGDTLFDIDYTTLYSFHKAKQAVLTVALRKVDDVSRYGSVEINKQNRIVSFTEKNTSRGVGLINGGIYLINKKWLTSLPLMGQFSFEKQILEKIYSENMFFGLSYDSYFIDIGIPDDYFRAQAEIQVFPTKKKNKRAVFLDRDGVINRQIIGSYVTKVEEFELLPGVLDSLAELKNKYDYIFIVTNQQGIGKGVFSVDELETIHQFLLESVNKTGGRIDKIYFCGDIEEKNSLFRKPKIGMGLEALRDYPDINVNLSVMIGDSTSDMEFGRSLGVKTIYLSKGLPIDRSIVKISDEIYEDLADATKNI